MLVILAFVANLFGGMPTAQADDFFLPQPGAMVHLSPPLDPPMLKGLKVHTDNPFRFDFILDQGASKGGDLKQEATKLIKYFLASLTVPETDLWVNLSPYERNRIIPQSFGLTEMGRDLLAEDYMLKQITASLIYPEGETGKKFWKRIYAQAYKKFGTTNVPVNTFNKVWIVPEKAVVYENAKAGTAYVVEARLKVMLEEDYLSLEKYNRKTIESNAVNSLGSNIVREIVIPELTREVNEDKNFAQLRQVYNSLVLATWYKKKIKDSILEQVYADKNKVKGVGYGSSNDTELIYQRYIKAFKKGVFNYIKEETDVFSQETIPRKYFSGGVSFNLFPGGRTSLAMTAFQVTSDKAMLPNQTDSSLVEVSERMDATMGTVGREQSSIDHAQIIGFDDQQVRSFPNFSRLMGQMEIKPNRVVLLMMNDVSLPKETVLTAVNRLASKNIFAEFYFEVIFRDQQRARQLGQTFIQDAVELILPKTADGMIAARSDLKKVAEGNIAGAKRSVIRHEITNRLLAKIKLDEELTMKEQKVMDDRRIQMAIDHVNRDVADLGIVNGYNPEEDTRLMRHMDISIDFKKMSVTAIARSVGGAISSAMGRINFLPRRGRGQEVHQEPQETQQQIVEISAEPSSGTSIKYPVDQQEAPLSNKSREKKTSSEGTVFIPGVETLRIMAQKSRTLDEFIETVAGMAKNQAPLAQAKRVEQVRQMLTQLCEKFEVPMSIEEFYAFLLNSKNVERERATVQPPSQEPLREDVPALPLYKYVDEDYWGVAEGSEPLVVGKVVKFFSPKNIEATLKSTAYKLTDYEGIYRLKMGEGGGVKYSIYVVHYPAQLVIIAVARQNKVHEERKNSTPLETKSFVPYLNKFLETPKLKRKEEDDYSTFEKLLAHNKPEAVEKLRDANRAQVAAEDQAMIEKLPTTPELAAEGVRAFQKMISSLPVYLRWIKQDADLLRVYTGVSPEIAIQGNWTFHKFWRKILFQAIQADGNMKVVHTDKSKDSILNLRAAQRVMEANQGLRYNNELVFPTTDVDWLLKDVPEWYGAHEKYFATIKSVRYGLLSGFSPPAVMRFTQEASLGLGPILGRQAGQVDIDYPSEGHKISGRSYVGFTREDRIWEEALIAIHNHALGRDDLKDKWAGSPSLAKLSSLAMTTSTVSTDRAMTNPKVFSMDILRNTFPGNEREVLNFLGIDPRDVEAHKVSYDYELEPPTYNNDILHYTFYVQGAEKSVEFYRKPKINYSSQAVEYGLEPKVLVLNNEVIIEMHGAGLTLSDFNLRFNNGVEAGNAVQSIARALATLHSLNILHGDLSPERFKGLHVYLEKRGNDFKTTFIDFGEQQFINGEDHKRIDEKNQLYGLLLDSWAYSNYMDSIDPLKQEAERARLRNIFNSEYEEEYHKQRVLDQPPLPGFDEAQLSADLARGTKNDYHDITVGSMNFRIRGSMPDQSLLGKLSLAVARTHPLLTITNNCGECSLRVVYNIAHIIPNSEVTVYGLDNLDSVASGIVHPLGWESPIDFANHYIAYVIVDGLYMGIDITSRAYIKDKHIDAEMIVANSRTELDHALMQYYGGSQWKTYQENRKGEVYNVAINGRIVNLDNVLTKRVTITYSEHGVVHEIRGGLSGYTHRGNLLTLILFSHNGTDQPFDFYLREPNRDDLQAIKIIKDIDFAQAVLPKGGIDFTAGKTPLEIQNGVEGGIKFHMDPAMLRQLQNAPGFVPVIINIQPLTNLRRFLGIQDSSTAIG